MNNKVLTLLICTLMAFSTAPATNAQVSTDSETNAQEQGDSSIWGVTYDWSHFEGDAFNMTGFDVNEINVDLREAASYAGFDLDYDQVLSGTTQVFVESWDDAGPFTVTTDNGDSHQVGKRITEMTIRHGSLADTGMATNWTDGEEKIDAWISAYQNYLMVMNANYVEYVDENMLVYGGEILLDAEFSVSMGFEAEMGVSAASETISPDISASMELSFEIPELEATWTPYHAFDYHFVMGSEPSQDSGGSHTYCSNEEFQTYQMCRDAELEDGETKFIQHHEQSTAELLGTFSSVTGYSMDLSAAGIPTEEFDVDIDVFNVALSDSIPNEGMIYSPEMQISSYAVWGHNCPTVSNSEVVVVDGTELQAQCGVVLPVPWAMTDMMEDSIEQAFESSVQELGDVAIGQVEQWIEEAGIEEEEEPYEDAPDFVCDNGETIPRRWFNDGYSDCWDDSDEISWLEDAIQEYENPYEMPTEFPDPTEGSSLHHVLDTGELTYCTDPFYPPFQSYDSNGTLVGFDVDVADYLASALSAEYDTTVEFVYVESEWDPIIPNLNYGYCDAIISAMTKTEEREQEVDFTRGYYTSSQGVIGALGSESISDVSDLNDPGLTIGVQSGTFSEMYAYENLAEATVNAYDDYAAVIEALDNGDVMYALGDTPVLSMNGTIMATFAEENLGIALREGNNELLSALDVGITNLVDSEEYGSIFSTWLEGDSFTINDWSPDWDFGWQESYDVGHDGFTCLIEDWQIIPSSGVGDGWNDCYDGTDENTDPESDDYDGDSYSNSYEWDCGTDPHDNKSVPSDFDGDGICDAMDDSCDDPEVCGLSDLERMVEALEDSNLERTLEEFAERLEALLEDNVPEEPKYDLEDLCATMLWDTSEVRVLGFAVVLEQGVLIGPQIDGSMTHPSTTINVEFLTGQAARDAKSGTYAKASLEEMAPASNHDLDELNGILGIEPLPDEVLEEVDEVEEVDEADSTDVTESDGSESQENLDSGDVNDVAPVDEDPEPPSIEEEGESSSLPANGLVASLSVIAAAAILIPRRDD